MTRYENRRDSLVADNCGVGDGDTTRRLGQCKVVYATLCNPFEEAVQMTTSLSSKPDSDRFAKVGPFDFTIDAMPRFMESQLSPKTDRRISCCSIDH